jgi:hypothetical protein
MMIEIETSVRKKILCNKSLFTKNGSQPIFVSLWVLSGNKMLKCFDMITGTDHEDFAVINFPEKKVPKKKCSSQVMVDKMNPPFSQIRRCRCF